MDLLARCLMVASLAAPVSALPAQAHHDPAHHRAASDSAFGAMQARGKQAMNVDQERSTHRFTSLPDGGQIELISDVEDTAAVNGIRRHMADIQKAFAAGDFSTPGFVHMQLVPGTATMSARAARIAYQAVEVPRGAQLRITTTDPDALAAIHQFLAFQRTEHHAGQ